MHFSFLKIQSFPRFGHFLRTLKKSFIVSKWNIQRFYVLVKSAQILLFISSNSKTIIPVINILVEKKLKQFGDDVIR